MLNEKYIKHREQQSNNYSITVIFEGYTLFS